jgi:hypothetical protein
MNNRPLAETDGAAAIMVTAAGFTDYLMTAFDQNQHTLVRAGGEVFTFSDYGYLNVRQGTMRVRGKVAGFRISAILLPPAAEVTVNEQKEQFRKTAGFVEWGHLGQASGLSSSNTDLQPVPLEQAASVHCRFQPEEVHLAAGGEKEVELHLRSVGEGGTGGQFRLVADKGLMVDPPQLAVESPEEGR